MEKIPQQQFADNFPLRFENGHVVDTLAFWCTKCGDVAHSSQVQGQVSLLLHDTADIRAMFSCSCGYSNYYRIRLKDDKSYSFMSNGIWREQQLTRGTLITGAWEWCREIYWYGRFKWGCFLLHRGLKRLQRSVRHRSNNHE